MGELFSCFNRSLLVAKRQEGVGGKRGWEWSGRSEAKRGKEPLREDRHGNYLDCGSSFHGCIHVSKLIKFTL